MTRILRPKLEPGERRALLWEGIGLFDAGRFFAAHESWETIWRSTTPEPRDLFQGLVQVAAGLHHACDRRRPDVAARVLAKARRRLAPLAPRCCGIDVAVLLRDLAAWEDWCAHPQAVQRPPPPRVPVADRERVR
ncbi:MAG TPA: DUF309 domain-containing protein [Thermoanaerobaculia bacterium]|nr:DUF309 domain-containing protein [Thermoanaerobaculia bacterium]